MCKKERIVGELSWISKSSHVRKVFLSLSSGSQQCASVELFILFLLLSLSTLERFFYLSYGMVLSLCREMSGGNFKLPRELSHQKDGEVTLLPSSKIRSIFMEAIKISRDLHPNCGLSTLVSIAVIV